MEIHEILVGLKVWVKERGQADRIGFIAGVREAVDHEDIETSINASTFIILLESGDLLETAGFNLSKIEHAGFIKKAVGSLLIDKTYIVRFKSPEISTNVGLLPSWDPVMISASGTRMASWLLDSCSRPSKAGQNYH